MSTLAVLEERFAQRYPREQCGIGIVHLGIGAFHRAHQAWYTDLVLRNHPGDWAICGVSLRSPTVRDQLQPQQGFYSLLERDSQGERLQVIGSVREVLFAPEDPEQVLERMASPQTRIVSLTVTEKGYCHDPATGKLNTQHPQILEDLQHPDRPHSPLGYLVAALRRRWQAQIRPFTVLCCDNLPSNGRVVRGLVLELAQLQEPALAKWIEQEGAFPSSMVDRIVPATAETDRARAQALLGVEDPGVVVTEGFSQWVLEDQFPLGRPAWEEVGVTLVEEVTPFEHMKLRMLNGTHSTLAYLGFLAGHETVADAATDPDFQRLLQEMWQEEIIPTLSLPESTDPQAYAVALLERYQNPGLRHRLYQIAMDGSQKLPQRLLGTLREQMEAERPTDRILLAIAGWMRYVTGLDGVGRPFLVQDPLVDSLQADAKRSGYLVDQHLVTERIPEYVRLILDRREIFAAEWTQFPQLEARLIYLLTQLSEGGVRPLLQQIAGQKESP